MSFTGLLMHRVKILSWAAGAVDAHGNVSPTYPDPATRPEISAYVVDDGKTRIIDEASGETVAADFQVFLEPGASANNRDIVVRMDTGARMRVANVRQAANPRLGVIHHVTLLCRHVA